MVQLLAPVCCQCSTVRASRYSRLMHCMRQTRTTIAALLWLVLFLPPTLPARSSSPSTSRYWLHLVVPQVEVPGRFVPSLPLSSWCVSCQVSLLWLSLCLCVFWLVIPCLAGPRIWVESGIALLVQYYRLVLHCAALRCTTLHSSASHTPVPVECNLATRRGHFSPSPLVTSTSSPSSASPSAILPLPHLSSLLLLLGSFNLSSFARVRVRLLSTS